MLSQIKSKRQKDYMDLHSEENFGTTFSTKMTNMKCLVPEELGGQFMSLLWWNTFLYMFCVENNFCLIIC